VSDSAQEGYETLIGDLWKLEGSSPSTPVPLPLTESAQKLFEDCFNSHGLETAALGPDLKGMYAKLKGYCPRLALIHAVSFTPDTQEIEVPSILAAAAQMDYFKIQAARVAERLCWSVGVGTDASEIMKCREGIRRSLARRRNSKREVFRNLNYPSHIFNAAWGSVLVPEIVLAPDGLFNLAPLPGTDIPTPTTNSVVGGEGGSHG
jgi:hypothetical protein